MADQQGMTSSELKEKLTAEMKDPDKLEKYLNQKAVSSMTASVGIGIAKVGAVAGNIKTKLFSSSGTVVDTSAFINGPKVIKVLTDFHAHQIFFDGLFNSDPHAGNVIIMPGGKLGLIDYGGVCALSGKERFSFAQLVISICDDDQEGIVQSFVQLGFNSKKKSRMMCLAYAYVCFHHGFDKSDLAKAGIPPADLAKLDILTFDAYLGKNDTALAFPPSLFALQRCVWEIRAMAMDLGAGNVSIAEMLRPVAIEYLKSAKRKADSSDLV